MIKPITITGIEASHFSIKPQDLGYDIETSEEIIPKTGTARDEIENMPREKSVAIRPNLMIYPGE
ncbi:MAG: hypothetical protein PWQ97_717 [Tepidanaerobacteraceae bacterium]|nr:hypothetical protein [Tepidanaerobacteraceae bacterium]